MTSKKTQNVGERNKKCRSFRMFLNLNDYLYEASNYNYGWTYVNPMVTTHQKLPIDIENRLHKH